MLVASLFFNPFTFAPDPETLRTLDPATLPSPAANTAVGLVGAVVTLFAMLWTGAAWIDAYRAMAGGGGESAAGEPGG